MIDSFIDFISDIVIRFLSGLPGNTLDLNSPIASLRTVLGYLNYFLPIHDMNVLFGAFVIMMSLCAFGFMLARMVRKAVPF